MSVIITDVTKTWLDLRAALHSKSFYSYLTRVSASYHSPFIFVLTSFFTFSFNRGL